MSASGSSGFCQECGAPTEGRAFCTRCGTPTIVPPLPAPSTRLRRRSTTGIAVGIVFVAVIVGVAAVLGVRWWISSARSETTSAAAEWEADGSFGGTGNSTDGARAAQSGSAEQGWLVPGNSGSAQESTAPEFGTFDTAGAVTIAPSSDSVVGASRHDVSCDHSYIVVLASSLSANDFSAMLPRLQTFYSNTKYLYTGGSCFNFGEKNAYALYDGPYPTLTQACQSRFAGTNDAYVKIADPTVTEHTIGCLCPLHAAGLPVLSASGTGDGYRGLYVGEAQYALGRQGIYDQDNAGTFTPETEQAVKTFQAAQQLPADGVVNAATWTARITADCH